MTTGRINQVSRLWVLSNVEKFDKGTPARRNAPPSRHLGTKFFKWDPQLKQRCCSFVVQRRWGHQSTHDFAIRKCIFDRQSSSHRTDREVHQEAIAQSDRWRPSAVTRCVGSKLRRCPAPGSCPRCSWVVLSSTQLSKRNVLELNLTPLTGCERKKSLLSLLALCQHVAAYSQWRNEGKIN